MGLILGHMSMIGRQLWEMLPDYIGISHECYDLTKMDDCISAFKRCEGEIGTVYLCSGMNGGLPFNNKYPFDIFHTTSQINLNVLKCCQLFHVDKLVAILASCSYPDLGNKFLLEEELWSGFSSEGVSCHGIAKRMLHAGCRQLNKQYGVKTICSVLTNCYGPGDRFDLERTKLVGAAIKRICDAKRDNIPSVTFFGTGKPLREIMYCRDAASCLIQLAESYDDYLNPVNVGSDKEVSVYDLAHLIKDIVGYEGEIKWDESKPDGQMRKKLSTVKMKKYVNHEMINLIDGLKKTVEYYREVGQYLDR